MPLDREVSIVHIQKQKFVVFIQLKSIRGIVFEIGESPKSLTSSKIEETSLALLKQERCLNEAYTSSLVKEIQELVGLYLHDQEHNKDDICIYACSELHDLLDQQSRIMLRFSVFDAVGVHLFFLTESLERLYISNIVPHATKCYIVNIGSIDTDISYVEDGVIIKRKRIDVGTDIINSEIGAAKLRSAVNKHDVEQHLAKTTDIILRKFGSESIEAMSGLSDIVVYLGREKNFLTSFKYNLEENDIFVDNDHEYMINMDSFRNQSQTLLFDKRLDQLRKSIKGIDDGFMNGTKPCTLIAISLFNLLKINNIVPSDYELLYGLYRKNFQKVVIAGSKEKSESEMIKLMQDLMKRDVEVLSPDLTSTVDCSDIICKAHHLHSICECDTLIVCNDSDQGYIGYSTLFDIGYAFGQNKRVITTRKPQIDIFEQIPIEVGLYMGG